jgi:hypothetical protein
LWEVLLGLLKERGVEDARLVAGVDMLLLHATTVAAEEGNRQAAGEDVNQVQIVLANASSEQFPLISKLFREGSFTPDDNDDDRFRWAIDVIIDGLLANGKSSGFSNK